MTAPQVEQQSLDGAFGEVNGQNGMGLGRTKEDVVSLMFLGGVRFKFKLKGLGEMWDIYFI